MATGAQALLMVDRLARELQTRQADIKLYNDYYLGKHNLRFAGEEFKQHFQTRYAGFSDNWTGVVAEAPSERLEVVGIRPKGDDGGDSGLFDVWLENDAPLYSDMAMLDAIVAKRSFALVWGDPPRITWEHPSQAIVTYDPETRARRAGLKLWRDETMEFATLYLPDEIWKWQRPTAYTENKPDSGFSPVDVAIGGWQRREVPGERWPLTNPFGKVPLVELRNRSRLIGEPISDIAGTVAMQDAVNLQWATLFVASDFASFPARVIIGAEPPMTPILDDEGQQIGERPVEMSELTMNKIQWILDENAKLHEWSAANLEQYTKVLEAQVGHIAAQTRTPQHYLVGKMANLSADALKAAETGLVKRTEEKTQHFGYAVREVFALTAEAQGDSARAEAVRAGTVLWKDVESRSEAQLVDALHKLRQIGFPFKYLAERYGLPPSEVERVVKMRQDEMQDEALADPVLAAGRMLGNEASPSQERDEAA